MKKLSYILEQGRPELKFCKTKKKTLIECWVQLDARLRLCRHFALFALRGFHTDVYSELTAPLQLSLPACLSTLCLFTMQQLLVATEMMSMISRCQAAEPIREKLWVIAACKSLPESFLQACLSISSAKPPDLLSALHSCVLYFTDLPIILYVCTCVLWSY